MVDQRGHAFCFKEGNLLNADRKESGEERTETDGKKEKLSELSEWWKRWRECWKHNQCDLTISFDFCRY